MGSLIKYQPKRSDTIEYRLLKKVIKDDTTGCWNWVGHTNGEYGTISFKNKRYFVHRASYEFLKGIIPGNLLVCHKCDNKLCLNPDHLFLGTKKDNTADMLAKNRGKLHLWKGVNNGHAKFNEIQIKLIKEAANAGFSRGSIARYFKVCTTTISKIVFEKTYKEVK